jgi:hypothetical protein
MKTTSHIVASAVAGAAAYKITGTAQTAAALFLGGVLIDLDHVLDYLVLAKEKHTVRNFFSWFNDIRWKRIVVVFHSYEFYAFFLLIALLFPNDILTGLAIGIGLHLIMDQFGNTQPINGIRLSWRFYFLAFRYASGFELQKMQARDS